MSKYLKLWLVAAMAMLMALPANARVRNDWVLLGEQTVGFRVDRDTISVANAGARFSQLRILAERNEVHLMGLRLVYQNGYAEDFRVDQIIRPGRDAVPVDLRGERSYLREIELTYKSRRDFEGRAVVKVYGELAGGFGRDRDRDTAGSFDLIDTQRLDRDNRVVVYEVGRREGRFVALRLRAVDGAARINSVRIVFGNNESQVVDVEDRLDEGDETRIIDLEGESRFIRRVEVEARASRRSGGTARLALLGREGARRGDHDDRDRGREEWVRLGVQKAGMGQADIDTFRVGREAGTFRAIRAYVEERPVRFYGMTIRYGNGETENVPLNGVIEPGQFSQAFDLRGRERFIESITFQYRSRLSLRGGGRVEIQGLKHGPYRGDRDRGEERRRERR